jgi:hypothetical protein
MAMTGEPPLTIPKNYNVAIGSFATSAALILGLNNLYAGIPFALLGVLLIVQVLNSFRQIGHEIHCDYEFN